MMDEGSHLVISEIVKEVPCGGPLGNISGQQLRELLVETWFQVYGLPARIRADPDGALMSKESVAFFGELGVLVLPCAGDAHWQIGYIERVIQLLKDVADRASHMVDPDCPSKVLWAMVCQSASQPQPL